MRTLTGTVTDSKGQPTYNARVSIVSNTGKKLQGHSEARTDFDGKYNIKIPSQSSVSERWIRILDPTTTAANSAKIKSFSNTYNFQNSDKGENASVIEEVTISVDSLATRCKKKGGKYNAATKECKTKSNWALYAILGGVGLLALGLIIYGATRKK
jgi:hypothetical protein